MESSTRLDSAVFQLTPTRTRCDLIIRVNGKIEKVASGLVQPFLDHLKTAQDQVAKGGYSIILEPGSDATWFTKGTVERFVRFVSTPEVLERVYYLESEILQIEKGIAIQSNNDMGLSSVEDHQAKPVERIEGSKPLTDSSEEKAIVLYKPGLHPHQADGLTVQEGNCKVQLMKALETRRTLLQKEQGMAFARAVAAGFDIDHMAHLISFAESFGALRLMDACIRFMELWKRKHETGQWVEIEGTEAMSSRSDFSSMNASGIVLSNTINKQWPETPDSKRNAGVDPSAGMNSKYERPPTDQQQSPGQQEYFQGQFPHPMFPPWPIHSPPGAVPVFPGYPMQGIPYYQNYPGNSSVFQPPYSSGEDPRINAGQRMSRRRHSMDSNTEPEAWEVDALRTRLQDETEEKETSGSREPGRRKGSRSGKRQSGTVVIRNINYITSKRQEASGSESQSASGSENDEEDEVLLNTTPNAKHRNSLRSSKRKGSHKKSVDKLNSSDVARTSYGKEDDGEHWKAFQNYLLKDADEAERAVDQGMFAMEKNVQAKRQQNTMGDDPLVIDGRDPGDIQEGNVTDMQKISGNWTRMTNASEDELLISRKMGQPNDGTGFVNGQMDLQSVDIDGGGGRYRMNANDDFVIHGQENKSGYRSSSSNPLAINDFETAKGDLDRRSSNNMDDDSYVVSLRSTSLDQVVTEGRNIIDVDSEFPSTAQKTENLSNRVGSQVKYEPDDLSLMPECGTEKGSIGYDPALDYDMQASLHKKNKVVTGQGSTKSDKYRKPKLIPDTSDRKKTVGPIRKGKPSKLSPLDEARARAEKLRAFKADLQKMKKEKEEEEIKRLEALKLERQKRIAARGSSTTALPALQQTRKQLPTKLSPSSNRGSKFSDSEPGSSSPLQRFSIKSVSAGLGDSQKVSRSSKLSTGPSTAGNRLTLSLSSLSEPKNDKSGVTPDSKASMARIRRLSEPKVSSSNHASIKPRKTGPVLKPKLSSGTESKKISAIMNHDKSKAASLPELKTKTTKGHDFAPGNSAAKEIPQKMHESKAIATSESTELKQNGNKISHHSDEDDNPIIEKTVVVLECEKPSIPYAHTTEHKIEVQDGYSNNYKLGEKTETVVDYAAIRAPVSPLTMDGIDRKHTEHQLPKHPGLNEAASVHASYSEKESPKLASTIVEKPYHAPYARVSSLEDPCTGNSEYGKAPPSSVTDSAGAETIKAHVSGLKSLKLEEIPEALEKPHTKESSKGFRQLLKFGRKSHATGERSAEINHVSLNGSKTDDNAASSSEVHTLKNLISQDETLTAGSNQKSSRHFSLLSPFRSKTGEKKLTT